MTNILKSIYLLSIIIMTSSLCYSQSWPKIYGDNISAYGRDVLESYDKGYLICGSIDKNPELFKFGWLIKTDINGNIIWNKKFGDYHVENFFIDFDKTDDQGLIISGSTAQEDNARDPLFAKLDPCGEIEWCKIFLSDDMNHATGVIHLPDGQFLGMLEYYGGDAQHIRISLVKMDINGEPIWIRHLAQQDSVANEEGMYLDLTPDSNYLVSGLCFSPGIKPYFVKTDTTGEELWNLKWPVGAGGFAGRSVFSSNGFIYNASHLKFEDLPKLPYLLKFNNSGEVINQYPLMGDTIYNGGAVSLLYYNDTVLYTGTTWIKFPSSFDGYCDILKIDTLGNLYLQRRLIDDDNPPTSIIKSFNGKIVAIGTFYVDTNWDIYMWKMNENLEDDTLYTQPLNYDSLCPYEIQSDTVLLDCGIFVNIDEIPTQEEYESTIKISPNPATDWVVFTLPDVLAEGKVEIGVFDVFGRVRETRGQGEEGKRGIVLPSNRMIYLDISGYSTGMYIVVVRDQRGRRYTGKFVVAR
jgi:hypothetical protein